MRLRRFHDDNLAQTSYLLASDTTDEAIVIDPNRDVDQYLTAAAADKVRITHVTETHIHADFVSGARDLVRRTEGGAQLLLSGEGGQEWQYRLGAGDGAVLLMDGDSFEVGEVRVDVLHTPGHTPEHLVFLFTDAARADRPLGAFTGDFVFVGDVGRPDLLERAARATGTMEESARTLFHSLRRMRAFPDYLQIWPGHGAGSACGKSLGAMPTTTLGYERLFNWAFTIDSEDEFVRAVLAGQPEPPRYFGRMKQMNRDGPPPTSGVQSPEPIDARTLARLIEQRSASVVDTRTADAFAAGFVPGSLNMPAGRSFSTWASSLLPPDCDVVLLVGDVGEAARPRVRKLTRDLALVGIDQVSAWAGAELFDSWHSSTGRALERAARVDADGLLALTARSDAHVIDVRGEAEWDAGHMPGARHIFLGELEAESRGLPRDATLVISCQGGTRSAIGASLLRARGFTNVVNFPGGFAEWQRRGLPVESTELPAGAR